MNLKVCTPQKLKRSKMNCWHCNTELIWGGDHDITEIDDHYQMVTNLSCPKCDCYVEVYLPHSPKTDE